MSSTDAANLHRRNILGLQDTIGLTSTYPGNASLNGYPARMITNPSNSSRDNGEGAIAWTWLPSPRANRRLPLCLPRRLTIIAAIGCVAVSVAGCGGGNEPAPKEPTTSSMSEPTTPRAAQTNDGSAVPTEEAAGRSSGSTTAKKPERADFPRIDKKNSAGANAALRYFIAGYRYGLLSGDPAPIDDLTGAGCTPCEKMSSDIESNGRHLRNAAWRIEFTSLDMLSSDSAEGASRVESSSTPLDGSTPTQQTVYIGAQMRWEYGKWKAYDISVEVEE